MVANAGGFMIPTYFQLANSLLIIIVIPTFLNSEPLRVYCHNITILCFIIHILQIVQGKVLRL